MSSPPFCEPLAALLEAASGQPCYGVVGNPVKHSRSPTIHHAFALEFDMPLYYGKACLDSEGFLEAVTGFFLQGGKGLNVTVPFKTQAFEGCAVVTERARYAGAVNTLWWSEAGLCGDNTDGEGLVRDLEHRCLRALSGQSVLILGAGGATRGVLKPLFDVGVGSITLANRTRARAEQLREEFSIHGQMTVIEPGASVGSPFSLIIHATGAGLQQVAPPLHRSWFGEKTLAYDMFYAQALTPFLQAASAMGVTRLYDGLGMLVEQAAAAFERWTGKRPQTQPVIATLNGST